MPVKAEPNDEVTERVYSSGSGMRQERLPAAGRRPRAGVKQRQQSSGGVGNIISSVLKKRNGISRSAPRLLCTLEPGDLRVYGLILNICRQSSAKKGIHAKILRNVGLKYLIILIKSTLLLEILGHMGAAIFKKIILSFTYRKPRKITFKKYVSNYDYQNNGTVKH